MAIESQHTLRRMDRGGRESGEPWGLRSGCLGGGYHVLQRGLPLVDY